MAARAACVLPFTVTEHEELGFILNRMILLVVGSTEVWTHDLPQANQRSANWTNNNNNQDRVYGFLQYRATVGTIWYPKKQVLISDTGADC